MALPSANAAKNVLSYSKVNLVPLRVNVVSDDKTVTLVETLLLDRYCWPIMPLLDPIEDSIQRNADALAYMLLSDMEVQGMGRTTRHFTGRVDLWSASLQAKIKDQLIPQLRHVAKTTKLKVVKRKAQLPSHEYEEETGNKDSKKQKVENGAEDAPEGNENGKDENNTPEKKEDSIESTPPPTIRKKKHSELVPVRLRLCVNGVCIHDDFIWDLSIPQCPIEFAQSLGDDLNLSDEAVVAIVTSIVEQLDGSAVEDTNDLDHAGAEATARKHATAAWKVDPKENMNNLQQLLLRHRPT